MKETEHSTDRRSTSIWKTPSEEPGSAVRSSLTSSCHCDSNCEYIGADGEKHRPIMIHRVAFGSIERFIGILIEHFAGAFPTWLSPVQVKVLPISDKYMEYGEKVKAALEAANIRTEIDTRAEKIGYKIREARLQKIPYMLVVGAKEEEENTVSVRSRFAGDEGAKSLDDFIAAITEEIKNRENRKVEVEEQK